MRWPGTKRCAGLIGLCFSLTLELYLALVPRNMDRMKHLVVELGHGGHLHTEVRRGQRVQQPGAGSQEPAPGELVRGTMCQALF